MSFVAAVALLTVGRQSLPTVTADELREMVTFLSDDQMAGRSTPSPELEKAADFIAGKFQANGLKPYDGKSFFQATNFTNQRSKRSGQVRNVIGVIPGTDPVLSKQWVLVTAHYDHVGAKAEGEGDRIYNGANDNASGTAGIIAIGKLLAKSAPKRSIAFIGFWGEEIGLRGSKFYAENPVFPLKDTVANVNLEQIGRTDGDGSILKDQFNLTGYGFSDMASYLAAGAIKANVSVVEHPQFSEPFFFASDNASLARVGIPSHTVSVVYQFDDYHGLDDEHEKLDYANMAKVVRALGFGVLEIANAPQRVKWNAQKERVKPFLEAQTKLGGAGN